MLSRIVLLAFALAAAIPSALSAQPLPYLVKDITTATDDAGLYQLTRVHDLVFFTACEPAAGCEIWKSDGTSVSRVSNFAEPDPYDFEITDLTAVGDLLFFRACDATYGCEIWKSDGATASIVADIRPGPVGSSPDGIRNVGGKLFFRACDAEHGCVLRSTDGVTVDVIGGTPWLGQDYDADDLAVANGTLFYPACDGTHGCEIWRNDGSGPVLVADIASGPASSDPYPNRHHLTAAGDMVYFTACADESGCELWATDGVTTALVADIEPGPADSDPFGLTAVGDTVFFHTWGPSGYQLWKSDGASVTPLAHFVNGTYDAVPRAMTNVGGRLFFFVCRELPGICELWTSDGVTTTAIADVPASTGRRDVSYDLSYSLPSSLDAVGDTLFFRACDETHGCELWKSDGVTTDLAIDILPGRASSYPSALMDVHGKVFLTALDPYAGRELLTTDGVTTTVVADINTTPVGSFPSSLTVGGDVLFFLAAGPLGGGRLWKTDGTAAGTIPLNNDFPDSDDANPPCGLTMVGDTLFFADYSPTAPDGSALWKSDRTGTAFVAELHPRASCSPTLSTGAPSFPVLGDALFFSDCVATSPFTERCRLSKTDGVTTTVVADFHSVLNVTVSGDQVFFTGCGRDEVPIDGTFYVRCGLWRTDGVTTVWLNVGANVGNAYVSELTDIAGTLFFSASFGLWKTDGTTTSLVAGIGAQELTRVGETLFFRACDEAYGCELWKSDGTTTVLVADIAPGAASSYPQVLTAAGGTLFFTVCDDVRGCELWNSDGTSTARVADVPLGTVRYESVDVAGTLYFVACTDTEGCELWRSDGTTAQPVADLFPGPESSHPSSLTSFRGMLFFTADDGTHGRELWAIPATCGNAQPNPGEECDDGNLASGDGCDASCQLESQVAPTPTPTPVGAPGPTPTPLCPAAPIAGCRTPGGGQRGFLVLEDAKADHRDKLHWKWSQRSITTNAGFGNPLAAAGQAYALCLYDGTSRLILDAAIPAGGTCGTTRPTPCWRKTASGYHYTNASGVPDGITDVRLYDRPRTGKATLDVSGKGTLLDDPALPLTQPVTVQLHGGEDSACWESTYSAPALKNGSEPARRFSDKAD